MNNKDTNFDDIHEMLERLKELDGVLNDESSSDISFIKEINEIIKKLNENDGLNQPLQVNIKKLHPNAVIPTYSKDGDAGLDLTITSYTEDDKTVTYGYGIAMEIPYGYVGLIFPRSSVRKYDLLLTNCVGVVDSGYRGEIMSTFKKIEDNNSLIYLIGDRGAQIIIIPYPKIQFNLVDELSKTERNDGGFGSTGN